MKYLGFYEWNYEDVEKINVLWKQLLDEREKGSDRFPKKLLFGSHTFENDFFKQSKDVQCFFICETKDPMHLINYRMHFAPYITFNFIPITDARTRSEAWQLMQK